MQETSIVYRVAGVHSKQPWFVINAAKDFSLLSSDNPAISHFYSLEASQSAGLTQAIPDGCIDILFDFDAHEAKVCGTTLEATPTDVFVHKHRYFGVRFAPGVIPGFLNVSAEELVNHQLNLLDVVPHAEQLIDQVYNSQTLIERAAHIKRFCSGKETRQPSSLTSQALSYIIKNKGNVQIQQLEELTNYTSRTLQRQFRDDMGMSPKAFSRIIRCQSAVYDINHSDKVTFSDLACDLGFSDQSHFLREFKKLVSTTPLEYQNCVKNESYLGRISYH